jgi:hypothetical protein
VAKSVGYVRLVVKVGPEVICVVALAVPPLGSLTDHVKLYGIPVKDVVTFRTNVMVWLFVSWMRDADCENE